MAAILRDLLRHNAEFGIGAVLVGIVLLLSALASFSPYPPQDVYVVPPDVPPSLTYWFGTTSRGQDVFWQLSFALRNTLLFGCTVALISRCLALVIGLLSGYKGGWLDRVLMSVNDTFIVIPLLPILVLFYLVMRDQMSWLMLAMIMACLGWAYDARLIRVGGNEPEGSRIHAEQSVLRHEHARDPGSRAPALCDADRVLDEHEQHGLVDRARGDAGGPRLHRH